MKTHANVALVIAIMLMCGVGAATAEEPRVDAQRESSDQERDRPEVQTSSCEQVGSGLYECHLDINCWEDTAGKSSVCHRITIHSDHDIP